MVARRCLLVLLGGAVGLANAQAGMKVLSYTNQTTACVGTGVDNPCVKGGFNLLYDNWGNVIGVSKDQARNDGCYAATVVGAVTTTTSTVSGGSLLLFDGSSSQYSANYTTTTMVMSPNAVPNCKVTFGVTTGNLNSVYGGQAGTLFFKSTVNGCPVNSCATSGWYYVIDGWGGLHLMSLSTNMTDICPAILGQANTGATTASGTFTGYYFASNRLPSFIATTGNPAGLTGVWSSSANSMALTMTGSLASYLGVGNGCTYNYAFTNGATSAAPRFFVTVAIMLVAVVAALTI